MPEAEWLEARGHPQWMMHQLWSTGVARTKVGRRKLRLFACGCCRLVWERLTDPRLRHAVEVAERFADGHATKEELAAVRESVAGLTADHRHPPGTSLGVRVAIDMAVATTHSSPREAASRMASTSQPLAGCCGSEAEAEAILCDLLRDVFGNPFRPLEPRAWPSHVVGLANACYTAFPKVSDEFLILADALEEVGDAVAAAHCREKLHVKGCHVVDWILEQS